MYKYPGIYAYYDNLKDEIVYIGQAINIHTRNLKHRNKWAYNEQKINQVIQNNPKRYDLILLKKCGYKELTHWEITLIGLFNPRFNYTDGGEGMRGYKHSEESRRRISESHKGIPSWNAGKVCPQLSEMQIGEKNHMWKDYARVIKQGVNSEGKQKYAIRYKGKRIKHGNDEYALQLLADGINRDNITFVDLMKDYAHVITRGKNARGKDNFSLMYNGKVLTSSVDKEKLEKLAKDINYGRIGVVKMFPNKFNE